MTDIVKKPTDLLLIDRNTLSALVDSMARPDDDPAIVTARAILGGKSKHKLDILIDHTGGVFESVIVPNGWMDSVVLHILDDEDVRKENDIRFPGDRFSQDYTTRGPDGENSELIELTKQLGEERDRLNAAVRESLAVAFDD